tara:strand:- start:364 stop:678 length:315 start_codon:yes stop_codon:yes gene_type:complete
MRTEELTGFNMSLKNLGIARAHFVERDCVDGLTHRCKRNLVESINRARMKKAVRVLVLTGSDRAVSAGDDISGQDRDISSEPLMSLVPAGHDSGVYTYEGLRDQ